MQGVGKDDDGILVLGATNIPWDLDPAVRRRFQKKIYIPLPDETARLAMLKMNVGTTPNNITEDDFNDLATMTEGFSGSDLATLNMDAIMEPIRKCQLSRFFRKEGQYFLPCSPSDDGAFKMTLNEIPEPENLKPPDVCKADFVKAMSKIKPTVSQTDLERQEKFTQEFGQEG
jgi:vacuolar protein-sorting-associated protein 4